MKYRIVQYGDCYIPEYKGLFFWKRWTKLEEISCKLIAYEDITFNSLEKAKDFIKREELSLQEKVKQKRRIIHPYPWSK